MNEYLLLPFVEIEIRLGTVNGKTFDSSIDKKYFEKIIETLNSGTWKEVLEISSTEYIHDNVKLINQVNSTKVIMKESVVKTTHSFPSSPFDFRFAVNQEFKLDSYITSINKKDSVIRSKNRKSFVSDNFRYDLTIVNQKANNINTTKHEVEIELLVNPETLTWTSGYINDFLECKIYDLINIVEPIERNEFKVKLI